MQLARIERAGLVALQAITAVGMLGIVAMLLLGVVARTLLPITVAWSDEIGRLFVIWITFIGALELYARREHMRMDIVTEALPPHWRAILDEFNSVVALVVFAIVFFGGILLTMRTGNRVLNSSGLPLWLQFLPVLVCSFGIVVLSAVRIYRQLVALRGRAK